jgi:hypothetical protein
MLVSDEEADRAMDYMRDVSPKLAKAIAQVEYLREFRKSKKAILMESSKAPSVSMAEMRAYAHPEYLELLEGLKVAVEEAERWRHLFKAAEMKVEVWRTSCANARGMR